MTCIVFFFWGGGCIFITLDLVIKIRALWFLPVLVTFVFNLLSLNFGILISEADHCVSHLGLHTILTPGNRKLPFLSFSFFCRHRTHNLL